MKNQFEKGFKKSIKTIKTTINFIKHKSYTKAYGEKFDT